MRGGRFAKGFAGVYAGYKWIESHADDVQRWCDKAVDRSANKPYGPYVESAAKVVQSLAKWIDENGGQASGSATKRRG